MAVITGGSSPYCTGSLSGPISGFDTAKSISSSAEAECLWSKSPYVFIGRYISNSNTEQPGDLSVDELNYLTGADWRVAVIQHALLSGSTLTASMGTNYGNVAVNNAQSISNPRGAYIWLDIEDYSSSSDPVGFCQSWSKAVTGNSAYLPALYYGAPGLTSTQVKNLLADGYFKAAWSGCGQTTNIGESIRQGPCATNLSETCSSGHYTLTIDEDTLLSNKTVDGFVVSC